MRILLTAINSKYVHTNISLRYLENYTKDLPVTTMRAEFSINEQKESILEEMMQRKPDLVAFSVYIWNVELVRELSVLIKKVLPSVKILYGGPEVSFSSRKHLMDLPGDFIIRGEGEETYRDLLQTLLSREGLERVRGLTYKAGEEIIENPSRPKMNLEEVPYPYEVDEDLTGKLAYLEASRGCPYQCSYCLSSSERDLRFMPLEEVKRRVLLVMNTGTKVVKFIDRTFNIHPDAEKIWAFLISLDTEVTFHFEISPDLIKEEHITLLKTAPKGRIQFEVGIQSTETKVLRSISRYIGFGSVLPKLKELLSIRTIHSHLDLIAGLPYDTVKTFRDSFNDVYPLQPDMLQMGFLKIIQGTPMERDAEAFGMVYSPFPPYEVLKTNWMSYEELRSLHRTEDALERYYNSGRFQASLKYLLEGTEDYFGFFEDLGEYIYHTYQGRSIGLKDQYKILLDFSAQQEHPKKDASILNEFLKYDWLFHNKKQYVPEFLVRNHDKNHAYRKNMEKDKGIKIHVEIFSVDVLHYIDTGELRTADTPVFYDLVLGEIIKNKLKK